VISLIKADASKKLNGTTEVIGDIKLFQAEQVNSSISPLLLPCWVLTRTIEN